MRYYRFSRFYGISAVNALEVDMDMTAYVTAYRGVEYQTVACIRNLCAWRSIPLDLILIAGVSLLVIDPARVVGRAFGYGSWCCELPCKVKLVVGVIRIPALKWIVFTVGSGQRANAVSAWALQAKCSLQMYSDRPRYPKQASTFLCRNWCR